VRGPVQSLGVPRVRVRCDLGVCGCLGLVVSALVCVEMSCKCALVGAADLGCGGALVGIRRPLRGAAADSAWTFGLRELRIRRADSWVLARFALSASMGWSRVI